MFTHTARSSLLDSWYCNDCDTRFNTSRGYEQHRRSYRHQTKTNHFLPKHPCPYCGREFSRLSDAKRHHDGGKCPMKTTASTDLSNTINKRSLSIRPNEMPSKIRKLDPTVEPFACARSASMAATSSSYNAPADVLSTPLEHPAFENQWRELAILTRSFDYTPLSGSSDITLMPPEHVNKPSQPRSGIPLRQLEERQRPELNPYGALATSSRDRSQSRVREPMDSDGCHVGDVCTVADGVPHEMRAEMDAGLHVATCTADSKDVVPLPDAMSSVSLEDECDTRRCVAVSDSGTLSSMNTMYGPKSLYQRPRSVTSRFTKSSGPEVPGPFNTSVDSELRLSRQPARPFDDCRPGISNVIGRQMHSLQMQLMHTASQRLLIWAKEGRSHVTYNTLLTEDIDINYTSPTFDYKTALMLAVESDHLHVAYALFLVGLARGTTFPLLGVCDHQGNTAMDLAILKGSADHFERLVKRIIAIICCRCDEQTRRDTVCFWFAKSRLDDDCGYNGSAKTKCTWGEKLCQAHNTRKELLEIDDCLKEQAHAIDTQRRLRMIEEWRLLYPALEEVPFDRYLPRMFDTLIKYP